jgi:hypothetical protein
MATAGWYPDPLGRAQVRYYDGSEWSQWAADYGESRLDTGAPVAGLPGPPDVPPPGVTAVSGVGWTPTATVSRFRPVHGLSTALTWVLAGSILAALATAGALVHRIGVIDDVRNGEFVTVARMRDAGDAVNTATGFLGLFHVAVFVLFVVFLFRAVKNTELWNIRKERWTPGWAIGAWFIPFANLVLPLLVVRETWRRSHLSYVTSGEHPGDGLVWGWWILFLAGYIAVQIDPWNDTLDQDRLRDAFAVGGCALLVVSAVLMILVVRRLATYQQQDAAFAA